MEITKSRICDRIVFLINQEDPEITYDMGIDINTTNYIKILIYPTFSFDGQRAGLFLVDEYSLKESNSLETLIGSDKIKENDKLFDLSDIECVYIRKSQRIMYKLYITFDKDIRKFYENIDLSEDIYQIYIIYVINFYIDDKIKYLDLIMPLNLYDPNVDIGIRVPIEWSLSNYEDWKINNTGL